MMYLKQEDEAKRFEIFGLNAPDFKYDIIGFLEMTVEIGKKLIDFNFLDPNDCQNNSPSNEEFVKFMEKYPNVTAHGYIVSPERQDVRISIEGLSFCGYPERELLIDFVLFNRFADELQIDNEGLYSWFD